MFTQSGKICGPRQGIHGRKEIQRRAILEFRNALKKNPRFAAAHYELGLAYLSMGAIEEGGESILQAATMDPNNLKAQFDAGNFLLLQRKFDDAGKKANLLLNKDPNNVRAQILLGNSLAGKIDLNESMGELKRGIDFEPRLLPAFYPLAATQEAKTRSAQKPKRHSKRQRPRTQRSIEARLALANFYLLSRSAWKKPSSNIARRSTSIRSRATPISPTPISAY